MTFRQRGVALLALVGALALNSAVRAEFVGYMFNGTLKMPAGIGASYNWFGLQPTSGSTYDVTGGFAYDTTVAPVDGAPGTRTYPQSIAGGFWLDVNLAPGEMLIQASEYTIGVVNDQPGTGGAPPTDQFTVSYTYDASKNITPERVLVNGVEWSGSLAKLFLGLTWDGSTFPDPDEPKLTPDRPIVGSPSYFTSALTKNPPATISLTTSPPNSPPWFTTVPSKVGDYNSDGKVDGMDFAQWRRTFGTPSSCCDGNHDGIVDASDYVLWREAEGLALSGGGVPEPGTLFLASNGVVLLLGSQMRCQRDARQR